MSLQKIVDFDPWRHCQIPCLRMAAGRLEPHQVRLLSPPSVVAHPRPPLEPARPSPRVAAGGVEGGGGGGECAGVAPAPWPGAMMG